MGEKAIGRSVTLAEFLNDRVRTGSERETAFTISAKVMRDHNDEIVILHALASFKLKGNKQTSTGIAWTTKADGVTPVTVEQLKVIVEAGGISMDSQFISSTSQNGFGFEEEFDSVPQRVTATAVSRGPDIEVTDTSDD